MQFLQHQFKRVTFFVFTVSLHKTPVWVVTFSGKSRQQPGERALARLVRHSSPSPSLWHIKHEVKGEKITLKKKKKRYVGGMLTLADKEYFKILSTVGYRDQIL